jgi:hypothetical protein
MAGSAVSWSWLVGVLLAITIPVLAYAFTSLADRVEALESRAETVIALEVEVRHLREQLTRIERLLLRELDAHHPQH